MRKNRLIGHHEKKECSFSHFVFTVYGLDCILEMDEYVYIFEFKMDGTAEEALQQIAEKGYARSYLTDNRKIVCIGVNFSSLTRTVEEWKEIIYR